MKIEVVNNNVILIKPSKENFEIHPLWLRERAKTNELVDKYNDQRLYDPSQLDQNLKIKKAIMSNGHLEIEFTDGIRFKFEVNNVEWVNTNYQASGMNFDDLINIHELFEY